MILFLRNISNDTFRHDIEKFISPVLKGGLFSAAGTIQFIKIFTMRDKRSKKVERHAIVGIDNEKVALRAIKKLNNTPLNGRQIVVREYHVRTISRENRAPYTEQRRDLEIIQLEYPKGPDDSRFHRGHNSGF